MCLLATTNTIDSIKSSEKSIATPLSKPSIVVNSLKNHFNKRIEIFN